jgi:hypothetical protein
MSDRKHADTFDTAHQHAEPDFERDDILPAGAGYAGGVGAAGAAGGVVAGPLDSVDDRDDPAEDALDVEADGAESYEGDDVLLSGHSPEFQRLTKRHQ